MLAKPVYRDEQIKLITECRQSGLTDYEWCTQHNIKIGTFYNWVKRLKHSEGITFPKAKRNHTTVPCTHDVVKLNVLNGDVPIRNVNDEYNNSTDNRIESAMRIDLPSCSVTVPNGTDPMLLETVLRTIGGTYAR